MKGKIKIDKNSYYVAKYTKGTYGSIDFIITEINDDVFVSFCDFVDVESAKYLGIMEDIKKQYLKKNNERKK